MNKNTARLLGLVGLATMYSASGDQASIKLNIVDDRNQPVVAADVVLFFQAYVRAEDVTVEAKTGRDGKADIMGWTRGEFLHSLKVIANKPGYYRSKRTYPAELDEREWNLSLRLRKIESPIPMYAKQVTLELPVVREAVGFDFQKADWVKPHGMGEVADCTFTGTKTYEDWDNNTTSVVMGFPGKHSGLMLDPAAKDQALRMSEFQSTRNAQDKGYENAR